MEASIRNTKIKITKVYIENNFSQKKPFTRAEISNIMYVREKEFNAFKDILFTEVNTSFILKKDFYSQIEIWKENQIRSRQSIDEIRQQFIDIFNSFKENYNYHVVFEKLKPLYTQLHWYYLPIYQDIIIENRGFSPEDDLDKYYDHFHTLEDLYHIISKPKYYWKTLKGDINLNQECDFAVYTNRWGHYDIYKVKRLYDGWYVSHLAINGYSTPSGLDNDSQPDGAFIGNFEQDYVEYPKSFHHIIGRLWELADEEEMGIEELQEKLRDVAMLISQVEKTVNKYTPKWY